MPETSKHSLIVPTLMKILLVIGVIAGFTACQESPNTTSKISSSNTSHVVLVDASLAHTYKSLKDLKRDSTLIVLGTVISR